jgi:hypothetical protein
VPRPKAPRPLDGCSVYLRPDQWARLRRAAHLGDVSVSRLLRDLIDEGLREGADEKQFVGGEGSNAPGVL